MYSYHFDCNFQSSVNGLSSIDSSKRSFTEQIPNFKILKLKDYM